MYLMRIFVGNALPWGSTRQDYHADMYYFRYNNKIDVSITSERPSGAMLFKIFPETCVDSVTFGDQLQGFYKYTARTDDTLIILTYGLNGYDSIAANMDSFMTIHYGKSVPQIIDASVSGFYGRHGDVTTHWPLPTRFVLRQNFPNPFNTVTTISFDLTDVIEWNTKIFNSIGREVRSISGHGDPGTITVDWDGTDGAGKHLASGIYFYKVTAGSTVKTRKMVLLK